MPVSYIVYAMGQTGKVKGKVFVPYRETDGTIPIFSEALQQKNASNRTQKAENRLAASLALNMQSR